MDNKFDKKMHCINETKCTKFGLTIHVMTIVINTIPIGIKAHIWYAKLKEKLISKI